MVEFYKGREIDPDKIQRIKDISKRKYSPEIFDEYFRNVNDVKDLARLHDISIDTESLAISSNWFLCYSETKYYVTILEWVSFNEQGNIKQVVEMMNALKQILITNKGKLFVADMRHDTSYKMYLKMIQDGYFKEISQRSIIDCAAPDEVQEIKYKYLGLFNSIEDFLSSDESNNYTEYFKYILHHLSFVLTNKFVEKYGCTPFEPKQKK